MSKSLLQLKAEEHLQRMSDAKRTLIRAQIGNRAAMYPFIVEGEWMYFLQNDELVCVSLQQENGGYYFQFNGQIIKIDSATGECFIVDFDKNCLEYFCVDDFFQKCSLKKIMNTCYSLLYRLLIRERIDRIDRRSVRSLRILFTMHGPLAQIEKAGQFSLKSPRGCLSIDGMIQGMILFSSRRLLSCFMSPLHPSIFRAALLANNVPQQRPSVDGLYGIKLLFHFRRPSFTFGMIFKIMLKIFDEQKMTGVFLKWIANGFLTKMSRSHSSNVSMKFIENPIGLRQAVKPMDKLLALSSKRTNINFSNFPDCSIADCVSEIIGREEEQFKRCKKRRDDWFAEQCRLEQEEYFEKNRKRQSRQELHQGIGFINDEALQTQKRTCILDEFVSGGSAMMIDETKTRKRGRELNEDDYSFLNLK
jgi:hypothetical protein